MDAAEQLKDDLRAGRLTPDRLVDLFVASQRELQSARQRIVDLEKDRVGSATPKVDEPFSLRAEETRQNARGPKRRPAPRVGRRGRFVPADEIAQAERTADVIPEGVARSECHLSHTRPVWRLETGRAILIAYRISRGPNNRYGKVPGVLGRSEFGLEIVVTMVYLVSILGLSFDKACLLRVQSP